MNLTEGEFLSLSSQMSDRDVKIAALVEQNRRQEQELLIARAEREEWKQKFERLQMTQEATEIENALLRSCLWLSWKKIKEFMSHVHDIHIVGLLQTFMLKTVSDEMGPRALEAINAAVELPDDKSANITNNFNGPVGQQVSHSEHTDCHHYTKEGMKDE